MSRAIVGAWYPQPAPDLPSQHWAGIFPPRNMPPGGTPSGGPCVGPSRSRRRIESECRTDGQAIRDPLAPHLGIFGWRHEGGGAGIVRLAESDRLVDRHVQQLRHHLQVDLRGVGCIALAENRPADLQNNSGWPQAAARVPVGQHNRQGVYQAMLCDQGDLFWRPKADCTKYAWTAIQVQPDPARAEARRRVCVPDFIDRDPMHPVPLGRRGYRRRTRWGAATPLLGVALPPRLSVVCNPFASRP